MAGIMNKIEEALHIGGGDKKKEEEKHKGESHGDNKHMGYSHGSSDKHQGDQHKEGGGMVEKIKDKIHGGTGEQHHDGKDHDNKEKKKKKDKKKKDGHDHGNSSSDSDSD